MLVTNWNDAILSVGKQQNNILRRFFRPRSAKTMFQPAKYRHGNDRCARPDSVRRRAAPILLFWFALSGASPGLCMTEQKSEFLKGTPDMLILKVVAPGLKATRLRKGFGRPPRLLSPPIGET